MSIYDGRRVYTDAGDRLGSPGIAEAVLTSAGWRMDGSWNKGKPYYRCQIRRGDPVDRAGHPPTIYLKEEAILPQVDEWLAELFDDEHLDNTCRALADATEVDSGEAARNGMRDRIASCLAFADEPAWRSE